MEFYLQNNFVECGEGEILNSEHSVYELRTLPYRQKIISTLSLDGPGINIIDLIWALFWQRYFARIILSKKIIYIVHPWRIPMQRKYCFENIQGVTARKGKLGRHAVQLCLANGKIITAGLSLYSTFEKVQTIAKEVSDVLQKPYIETA